MRRSACVLPDSCRPRSDPTTTRMRRAAVEQLRTSGAAELRASWQLDSFFDRTFIVNMRSRTDRRHHMQRVLAQHGARKVQFFEAVDGRNASLQEPERWRERMMTDEVPVLGHAEGQIGCYLSHYGVYKAARTAGLRSFLVLEDDAVLRPSAGKRFRQAIAQLPDRWDALYLGYNRYFDPAKDCAAGTEAAEEKRCRCGDAVICRARANLLHTHAIVVHARALDWLLPMLSKVEEGRSTRILPIDLEIKRRLETDSAVRVYAVLPSPVVTQNRSSASNVFLNRGMYRAPSKRKGASTN